MIQRMFVTLDTRKTNYKNVGKINHGDDLILELTVLSDGDMISFNNPMVDLLVKKSDGKMIRQNSGIEYIQPNKFIIEVKKDCVTSPGLATNQLIINDNGRISTCMFYYTILNSLEEDVIQSISSVEVLEQLDEYVIEARERMELLNNGIKELEELFGATSDNLVEAEMARNEAEQNRAQSEILRLNNENDRIEADNIRNQNEVDRLSSELVREERESERILNEEERHQNEYERVMDESTRQQNENARQSNESIRISNETDRKTQENRRVTAETNRVNAETIRRNNENSRISNESERQKTMNEMKSLIDEVEQNENARQSNESIRMSNENDRKTQENRRVTAETNRVNAETNRVNAETTRRNNENSRISNETERQKTIKEMKSLIGNVNERVGNIEDEIEGINSSLDNKVSEVELISKLDLKTDKTTTVTIQTQINSLASGAPKGVYTTLSALTSAYPSGNNNIYIVTSDGGWYYWNNNVWTKGGVYQGTLIANDSITKGNSAYKENLISTDIRFWQMGNSSSEATQYSTYNSFSNTRISLNPKYHIVFNTENKYTVKFKSDVYRISINEIDDNGTTQFDSGWLISDTQYNYTKKTNSTKIKVAISKNDNSTFDIRDCLKDIVISIFFGESSLTIESNSIEKDLKEQDYLDNLSESIKLDGSLFKQGNLNWDITTGQASYDGNIFRVAYMGYVGVTDRKYLYLDGAIFNDFDIYVRFINKANSNNDSYGWVTEPTKLELPPYSEKVMFCFRFKDNSMIYPYFIENVDFYVGYVPRKTSNTKNYINYNNDFLNDISIKNVAHRGYSSIAPENSYPSFVEAGKNGFWGIETDLQETKDGKIIICHDETLERTTNGSGEIINYTFEELRKFKITYGVNINSYGELKLPTLEEYLLVCKKYNCVPIIELKNIVTDGALDLLLEKLKKYNFENKCVLISFNVDKLAKIREKNKTIHLQPLISLGLNNIRTVLSLGNASLNSPVDPCTETNILLAHSYGVLVQVNTPNTEELHKQCIRNGIDMITSNYIYDYDFSVY